MEKEKNKKTLWRLFIFTLILIGAIILMKLFVKIDIPMTICDGNEYYSSGNELKCCKDCVDMGYNYLEYTYLAGGFFKSGSVACYCKNNKTSIKIWGGD